MRRVLPSCLVLGAALLVGGCAGAAGSSQPGGFLTATAGTSATSAPATTSAAPSGPATTAGVSPALAAALDKLSAITRGLPSVTAARTASTDGNNDLGTARTAITTMRAHAYGTARSCPILQQQRQVVATATAGAARQAAVVDGTVAAQRAAVGQLTAAANAVRAVVAAQHQDLASLKDVSAALGSTATLVKDRTSTADALATSASSLRSAASGLSGNAGQIVAKAGC